MKKALIAAICASFAFPAFAGEPLSLEERLEQLEQKLAKTEDWLRTVARSANGTEQSWYMDDVTHSGLTIMKTYYGHIAYSLSDIKPFGSGAEVTVNIINMQSTDFTNLDVELHIANASVFDTSGKKRKEEVVKSTIPVAKGGVAVSHKIKVKMPASDIKEWGIAFTDWGGLKFSRDK